jgi:hypothetical protein
MNYTRARVINAEDCLICKMTLTFLFTPLVLLILAGALIAV